MLSRRFVLLVVGALTVSPAAFAAIANGNANAVNTVRGFDDALLAAMKNGRHAGFAGRRDTIAPAMRRAFDLPQMTRLMTGLQWQGLSSDDQAKLVAAFSDFSVASYANHFDNYGGESFEVDPQPVDQGNGDVVVKTKLVQPKDDAVQLNYLLRKNDQGWKIIDVYLSGTISELASRRSEFGSVMRRGGVTALIDQLHQKTAQLAH
jgi:phospholipid transport system substrate-binding protein